MEGLKKRENKREIGIYGDKILEDEDRDMSVENRKKIGEESSKYVIRTCFELIMLDVFLSSDW